MNKHHTQSEVGSYCKNSNIKGDTSLVINDFNIPLSKPNNIEIRINHGDKKYYLYQNNNFICELPHNLMKQDLSI